MNIKEYINEYRKILEDYIEKILEKNKYNDDAIGKLYSLFGSAAYGGKCIRGALVKLGYEIAAGSADSRIIPISAAFEVFQTAILCHDDIIDCSPLRRGKPSIWKSIADESGSHHYGTSQAICLGDYGFFLATNLISTSDFDAELKIRALDLFYKVEFNTINGEMLDVQMTEKKDYSAERRIIEMASLKTACYTIIGPMQLGAVLGGGASPLLRDIEFFGRNLGIAFQLRDDILGVRASEAETGKSDMSDVAEGKVTLLIHHALKNANDEQREKLLKFYGKSDLTRDEKNIVCSIFEQSGAFEKVEEKAVQYLEQANRMINELTSDEQYRELLRQLSGFMVERKY